MTKKLDLRKAIEISKLVYDVTGLNYGECLPYSTDEFIALLSNHPVYADSADRCIL